jgi:hypothetical protein
MSREYFSPVNSEVSLQTVYAWQDGVIWYYADKPECAPDDAIEVDCVSVGDDVVLRHEVGGTFEAIWGARKARPK